MPNPDNNSNLDPDSLASDDELQASLCQTRQRLALERRCDALKQELSRDWAKYAKAKIKGLETGASPLSKLKTEAMAIILTLGDFHCHMAHKFIDDNMHDEAHVFAIDEGILSASLNLLSNVDTESF